MKPGGHDIVPNHHTCHGRLSASKRGGCESTRFPSIAVRGVPAPTISDDVSGTFSGDTKGSFQQCLSELEIKWEQRATAEQKIEAEAVATAAKKKADAASKPSLRINGRIHSNYWNFTDDSPGIGSLKISMPRPPTSQPTRKTASSFAASDSNLKVIYSRRCFIA